MMFHGISGRRLLAPCLALALATGGIGIAHAQSGGGGSNNANPLTSQTPSPTAPATSTPGTTASPQSTNTSVQPKGHAVTRPVQSHGKTQTPMRSHTGSTSGGAGGSTAH